LRGQTQADSRSYLAYLRLPPPDILPALKELQRSSLKLDFNVSTFAKEALCVPEASDIASRMLQKCDELINVTQRTGVNKMHQKKKKLFHFL